MAVNDTAKGYTEAKRRAKRVRDCVEGQDAIKAATITYLPVPNPAEARSSTESKKKAAEERYAAYLQRALFVNVTGRTHEGLLGAIMREPPTMTLPSTIAYAEDDCDGAGTSLEQLAGDVVGELMEAGTFGLLVDYPAADATRSAADERDLGLRATIARYPLESIINWRAVRVGAEYRLALVVLAEKLEIPGDEFTVTVEDRYRVLRLTPEGYSVTLYDDTGNVVEPERFPTDAARNKLREIPFAWIGARNNRFGYQKPPLIDIADVNISHYQNSADHEEAVFMASQPTMVLWSMMSGADFREANPDGVQVGSRSGIYLGGGGGADLLQFQSGGAGAENMKTKIDMMVQLGARLITSRTGTQTAEAARIDASAESSALAKLANNASEAIEKALRWMVLFMGGDPNQVEFELNKEFFDTSLSPQEVMALIQLADRGDIAKQDIRSVLRRGNWLDGARSDEDIDGDVANEGGGLPAVANTPGA